MVARLSIIFAIFFSTLATAMLVKSRRLSIGPDGLMLIGLIIAPYVLLALAARFGRVPTVTIGSLVLLILMGTDASLSYVDVAFHLWSEPDAEAAMAFIFIPTVQIFISLISIGLLVGIGEWLARRREKGADESAPSSDR